MNETGLPKRTTSIERFHLYDDSPEFPNNIFARLVFEGTLDESISKRALDFASERHPIAYGIVRRGQWREHDNIWPRILWNRGDSVASQWLNLELEKCCRLFFNYDSKTDETTLLFQVHHAAVDGQGGLQFVRDWMKIYDNLAADQPPFDGLPDLDASRYRSRNRLGLLFPSGWKTLFWLPIGLFGAFKFSFRAAASIIRLPELDDDTLKDDFPAVSTYEVDAQQVKKIRAFTNRQGITINDWMVSCCYQSLMFWREQFGQHRSRDWYRVIIPMSIRSAKDRKLPACNRAALVQLDRNERMIVQRKRLMKSVSFELNVIRKAKLQKIFLLVIKLFSLIPFWLRSRAKKQTCRATTVFTNVGRPLLKTGLKRADKGVAMAGAKLKQIEVVPPIRYGTPVTFAVVRYAGRLLLTMHVDTRFIRMEDAKQLLDDMGNRICDTSE